MVNTLRVNAENGRHFDHLADDITKLRYFTRGEIRQFSSFSFQLMFNQTLSNLKVCLIISHTKKLHTKVAQTI